MTSVSDPTDIARTGEPALAIRIFGWGMLGVLAAFLINNILVVAYGFPGTSAFLSGAAGPAGWVHAGVFVAAVALAAIYVLRTPYQALRWDARRIHSFNCYLIRSVFWAVLLVGIVDATIAFMRVEQLFLYFMDEEAARFFARARQVGPNIHVPLIVAGFVIGLFTRTLGFQWLALLIVMAELLIVISRFVFSYEQALMGDLVRYWYAALFLFASAYTLFDEGHVRVDVLYAGFGRTTKGFVNAAGSILLGMSTAWVILAVGLNGRQSIINSPITNFEVTQTGGTGMFVKYQMAAFLGIFAVTMLIQFVSYLLEAVADYRDEPGHRDHNAVTT
ncbi:TRAP transporter small permease subunit [Lutimaribacter sp. EGI FJ00015]|uniref:TRAP transporter small permease subunit n=1 Tax=Lutimaribacter degradans TaxID=2945989 RepID=A0ACC5ZYY8_9RHOB|nr:TRAP transporter small permease subunit [Lutimaribacter sp. EGI FJ00013]MCM2563572.1 TRAP transporter small permease subunit [Lutimaribacter sp. EGI FJ00013]MCO0614765.1 TRAP transporter small permease subunit [Lutimaribacter sp. EGI FJ00015]MCO0637434.1 TRAP transporter small permease subunit [Lutimaribacter sp. EGI FJ00014]